jgi:hypothetical protein
MDRSHCITKETCLAFRRRPTYDEVMGRWADRDECMNCKKGKDFERQAAREDKREETPDLVCLTCYEPITPRAVWPICRDCGLTVPRNATQEEKRVYFEKMRGLEG